MRPKYTTSYRPHGKWGDFFACVIPVSWCFNILVNSNFILRLIEWQNESSLFTLRVRGKQWYWVYKFELKNFTDILSTPKNVGNNKWLINVFGDLQTAEDYHHILQLRSQNKWVKTYWSETIQNGAVLNKNHIILPQEQVKFSVGLVNSKVGITDFGSTVFNAELLSERRATLVSSTYNTRAEFLNILTNDNLFWQLYDKEVETFEELNYPTNLDISDEQQGDDLSLNQEQFVTDLMHSSKKEWNLATYLFYDFLVQDNSCRQYDWNKTVFNTNDYIDVSATNARRSAGSVSPVRLLKNPLLADNFALDNTDLLRFRFNDDSSAVQHKIIPHTTYLTIKQKRYKRKKGILPTKKFVHTEQAGKTKQVKMSYKPLLINNAIIEDVESAPTMYNPTRQYRLLKKNKMRSEVFSVVTNRRMLRTKRTLVIPAHVNITIISNSYDVVHAWWIPGLGIKIDCVPGRSTHHTFFVDNVGFYYGQCAEICGRYHHHMPIRICALPFEHFLVWWYSFGLPKLLYTKQKKRIETSYSFAKYVW